MTAAALPDGEAVPLVRISNVWKKRGANIVLKGVNLVAEHGKVMCLLGPSGAGKSTLLRCINAIELADRGMIYVDGVAIGCRQEGDKFIRLSEREVSRQRADIGMVFQSFNLFPHMSVLENIIDAPMRVRGESRAAATRALAMQPKLMLFDEPTSALDPHLTDEVLDVIKGLAASGMTMIVVTHEVQFARELADVAAVMADGVIIEVGPARDVLTRPQDPRTRKFLAKSLQDHA
jgi:polar amino acid transport system ATP-binding protein